MHEILSDIDMKNPSYHAWNSTTINVLMGILILNKVCPDYTDKTFPAGKDDIDRAYELLKGYLDWNYKTPRAERIRIAEEWIKKVSDEMNAKLPPHLRPKA